MSRKTVHTIRVRLTDADTRRLAGYAERGFTSAGDLASKVVSEWINRPSKAVRAEHMPGALVCDGGPICHAHRELVKRRASIVKDWRTARANARRRGQTIQAATAAFLRTLADRRDVRISRATLFLWDRRYRSGGLLGLVDRRRIARRTTPTAGGQDRAKP